MEVAGDVAEAVRGADAAVILTEWSAYRCAPWAKLAVAMRRPLVVDLRNVLDPAEMARNGIEYVPLGRTSPAAHGDADHLDDAAERGSPPLRIVRPAATTR
jgi:hypothetical protein